MAQRWYEQCEVAATLHFFGVAAHYRFGGLAGIGSHCDIQPGAGSTSS